MDDQQGARDSAEAALAESAAAVGEATKHLTGQRSGAGDDLERIKARLEEARIAIEESRQRLEATLEEAARTIEAPGPTMPE